MAALTRQFVTALSLSLIGFTAACADTPTASRWEEAQTAPSVAQSAAVLPGSSFNAFFPDSEAGYSRVFVQEKQGFAEAKLQQGDREVALLSINDIAANPSAADKYRSSSRRIAEFPAVEVGSTATSVLVGDRIQVKVLSRNEAFTAADREAWLQKFDLTGLEALAR